MAFPNPLSLSTRPGSPSTTLPTPGSASHKLLQDLEQTARQMNSERFKFSNPILQAMFDVVGEFLDSVGLKEFKNYASVLVPQQPPKRFTMQKPIFAQSYSGMTWQQVSYDWSLPADLSIHSNGDMSVFKTVMVILSVMCWMLFYITTVSMFVGAFMAADWLVREISEMVLPIDLLDGDN